VLALSYKAKMRDRVRRLGQTARARVNKKSETGESAGRSRWLPAAPPGWQARASAPGPDHSAGSSSRRTLLRRLPGPGKEPAQKSYCPHF